MSKKNKQGPKVPNDTPVVEEIEVDVEALNAEAEDLIGDEAETEETQAPVVEETKEKRFLGYDVITKEKVYG